MYCAVDPLQNVFEALALVLRQVQEARPLLVAVQVLPYAFSALRQNLAYEAMVGTQAMMCNMRKV